MDTKRRREGGGPESEPPFKRANGAPISLEEEDQLESFDLDAEDVDQRFVEEDLEVELGEAGRNWERPTLKDHDAETTDLSECQRQRRLYISARSFAYAFPDA